MLKFLLLAATFLLVYDAEVIRVVDGDTVNVRVRVWHEQYLDTSIRLRGIDAPEIKGKCEAERVLAEKAKQFTAEWLPVGSRIFLANVKPDKFGGRYDADVILPTGKNLSELLISEGLARPYSGEKRLGWCG